MNGNQFAPAATGAVAVGIADPEEAHAVGTRVYHEHSLTILGDPASFRMHLRAAAIGPVTLGWLSYDTAVRLESPEFGDSYQVNLLGDGFMQAACGGQEIMASPELGMVYRADRPTAFTGWQTAAPLLGLKISRPVLERELEHMLGHPVSRPIAFDLGLDLRSARGAQWTRLAAAAATAAGEENSLLSRPVVAAPLIHALLAGLLLCANHDFRARLDAPATPAASPATTVPASASTRLTPCAGALGERLNARDSPQDTPKSRVVTKGPLSTLRGLAEDHVGEVEV
jgi:hypothetical protein